MKENNNNKNFITILTGIRPTDEKLHIGHYALFKKIGDEINNILTQDLNKTVILYIFIADYHAIIQFSDEKKKEILENIETYSKKIKIEAETVMRNILKEVYNIPDDKFFIYTTIQSNLKNMILPLKQLIENFISYSEINSIGPIKEAKEKYGDSKNTSVYVPQSFYNYPLLQIADIIVHNPDIVIVGKDQQPNLRLYNDIHLKLKKYVPEKYFLKLNIKVPYIKEQITIKNLKTPEFIYLEGLIPGTDGRKMSKSYKNILDINISESDFINQFLKYPTDGHRLYESGDYTRCSAYKILDLLPVYNNFKSQIKIYCQTQGSKCKTCKEAMASFIYNSLKSFNKGE